MTSKASPNNAGGIETNKVRIKINSLSPYVPNTKSANVKSFSEVFFISIPPFLCGEYKKAVL